MYNKDRVFAFVNALGDVNANGPPPRPVVSTGAFPTLADTDIPEILPTGICTYEHVVGQCAHDEMVQKSVEVRGLKVTISEIDIPCAFGPALRGRACPRRRSVLPDGRRQDPVHRAGEMAEMNDIEDGKVKSSEKTSAISKKATPSRWAFCPGGRP
jgi:acetyl-CoA synthase